MLGVHDTFSFSIKDRCHYKGREFREMSTTAAEGTVPKEGIVIAEGTWENCLQRAPKAHCAPRKQWARPALQRPTDLNIHTDIMVYVQRKEESKRSMVNEVAYYLPIYDAFIINRICDWLYFYPMLIASFFGRPKKTKKSMVITDWPTDRLTKGHVESVHHD